MKYPPIMRQVPHIVHGGDYNPDQWLREKDVIWKEDMRLAKLAGLNSLSVGIFSWAALEPEEGVYDFAWLDEILDRMADNGLTAVLATPSARGRPAEPEVPEVLARQRAAGEDAPRRPAQPLPIQSSIPQKGAGNQYAPGRAL